MINQKERNLLFLRTQYQKCDPKDTERIEKLDDAIYACEYCNCGYAHTSNAFIHADYCRTKESKGYCPDNYDYLTGKTSIVTIEIDEDDESEKVEVFIDPNHDKMIEQLLGNKYKNFFVGYDTMIIDELVNKEKEKTPSTANELIKFDDFKLKDPSDFVFKAEYLVGVDYADLESKVVAQLVLPTQKEKSLREMQKISRLGRDYGMKDKTIVKYLFDTETSGFMKYRVKQDERVRDIWKPLSGKIFKEDQFTVDLPDGFNPIRKTLKELEEYDYKIPNCRIVVSDEELAEHIEKCLFKKDDVHSKRDLADSLAVSKFIDRRVINSSVTERYSNDGLKDYLLENCERDRDIFSDRWEYLFDLTKINKEQ